MHLYSALTQASDLDPCKGGLFVFPRSCRIQGFCRPIKWSVTRNPTPHSNLELGSDQPPSSGLTCSLLTLPTYTRLALKSLSPRQRQRSYRYLPEQRPDHRIANRLRRPAITFIEDTCVRVVLSNRAPISLPRRRQRWRLDGRTSESFPTCTIPRSE